MADPTIIPPAIVPVITGAIIATIGILAEKHYVGKQTILVNGLSFIFILATIPFISVNFWIASPFFIVGLFMIITDVRKKAKKGWVAFALGSKTLGALSMYVASSELGWIQNLEPIVRRLTTDVVVSNVEIHALGFVLIFGTVYILGLIAWSISKLKQRSRTTNQPNNHTSPTVNRT